jgi:hypothetical protein
MFITLPDTPMPPHYQSDDCRYVYRSVRAGESCSLIGIGSVGKSNLLQNLTRAKVKEHHLDKNEAPYLIMVYLDPHTLVHLRGRVLEDSGDLWAGYELMLSRLYRTLKHMEPDEKSSGGRGTSSRKKNDDSPLSDEINNFLYRMYSSESIPRQTGLRHLEDALYTILSSDDRWQVTFMLDEFSAFGSLPALFFQSLRGLRDQYKGRVAYVTTSRDRLDAMLDNLSGEDRSAMKEFTELFRDNTRYISPLDAESAVAVVDRFIDRYEADFNIYDKGEAFLKQDVFNITGGHVGLLRRSFKPAVQYLIDGEPGSLSDYLLKNASVVRECETILNSLTEDERRVFYHVIKDGQIQDMAVWHTLFEKHIVKEGAGGSADFRSPLLGAYAMHNPDVLVGRASRK